jgi:hypothetical protein
MIDNDAKAPGFFTRRCMTLQKCSFFTPLDDDDARDKKLSELRQGRA